MSDSLCVPNYVLDKIISQGKKNIIFKAHDAPTKQSFAIKVSKIESTNLGQEFSVMATISHPAVMKPHALVPLDSGGYALILPFAERGDLLKAIANFPLTEREGKSVFYQIATAVRDLRAASISHRDIKLENIMVTAKNLENLNSVQLADFGFARRFENGICEDEWVGSLQYAPEILKHLPYTEKVDIWSLAVTIFAAMTKTFPYDPNRQQKKLFAGLPHLVCSPEMQGLSFPLKDLLRRMLEIDPEKRLSAEEVVNHRWFDSVRSPCETVKKPIAETAIVEFAQNRTLCQCVRM
jgi:serine/threonine protein kinase